MTQRSHRDLPHRTPRDLPLIEWVDRFTKAHPDITVSMPVNTPTARWEVSEPGQPPRAYENGKKMRADLEERYPTR